MKLARRQTYRFFYIALSVLATALLWAVPSYAYEPGTYGADDYSIEEYNEGVTPATTSTGGGSRSTSNGSTTTGDSSTSADVTDVTTPIDEDTDDNYYSGAEEVATIDSNKSSFGGISPIVIIGFFSLLALIIGFIGRRIYLKTHTDSQVSPNDTWNLPPPQQ